MTVKITIIGMDALGQSLGLALKASEHPLEIVGHDREPTRSAEGVRLGAIDRADWNLLNAVEQADLVFLNEPLHQLRETIGHIAPELRADSVVTDTSPVKGPVATWCRESLPASVHYVAASPMVDAVRPDATLFQGERYALMPAADLPEAAVRLVTNAILLLGAEPLFIEAAEHDSFQAATNQLPILTSAALLSLASESNSWSDLGSIAGRTFGNATSFPVGDASALTALVRQNREMLMLWLRQYQARLETIGELVEASDEDEGAALAGYLAALLERREQWESGRRQDATTEIFEEGMKEVDASNRIRRMFLGRRRDR